MPPQALGLTGPRLQLWSLGLLGARPLQLAPTCTSCVEVGQETWKALTESWFLVGCCTGPKPLTWSLQTLLVGGLLFPSAPPLAASILSPATENWLVIIGTAPEKKQEEDQVA